MTADRSCATLVYESPFETAPRDRLDRTLAALDGGDRRASALVVLYRGDLDRWTDALRRRGRRLSSAAVVGVGPAVGEPTAGRRDAVRVVSDPTDLTGVGIAVSEWLDAREPEERPVVCLDSLSTVLQYAAAERTFRFLHALTAQFRSNGARASVSVDPDAHDESTLATIRTLFGAERGRAASDDAVTASESAGSVPADGAGRAVVTDGGDRDRGAPDSAIGPTNGPE